MPIHPEPARLNALAFTRGVDIHLAPGQDRHLAHEAWHVVQQKQGRVSGRRRIGSERVNDDPSLEHEADTMGEQALGYRGPVRPVLAGLVDVGSIVQRRTDPPSEIVVKIGKSSGKVTSVTDGSGKSLPFDTRYPPTDPIAEGTVLLWVVKGQVKKASFATDPTKVADFGGMPKIAKVKVEESADSPTVPVVVPISTPKPSTRSFEVSFGTKQQALVSPKPTGFEITRDEDTDVVVNQGDVHYEKHGEEFGSTSKADYIKKAREFAADGSQEFLTVLVGKTFIKTDPVGTEKRRVLVLNGKLIRTFYVWDRVFTDPFAYAVYYTLTSTLKTPLRKLDKSIQTVFTEQKVDLFGMEIEVIAHGWASGKASERIYRETLAPEGLIRDVARKNWAAKIDAAVELLEDGNSIPSVSIATGVPVAVIEMIIEESPLLKMTMAMVGGGRVPSRPMEENLGEESAEDSGQEFG